VVRKALRSRAMTEYAAIDHGRDMAASGAGSFAAWTVVFGNLAAGAELLDLDMTRRLTSCFDWRLSLMESGGSEICSGAALVAA
jgi:hypothetical protein